MNYPQVGLRPGEERDLRTGKLWIYENELEWAEDTCQNGNIVAVLDAKERFAAYGFFNALSKITVRVLSFDEGAVFDREFFRDRIQRAWDFRRALGFSDACRVVFGESDGLPGLTVDKFGDYLSFQIVSLGMERRKQEIIDIHGATPYFKFLSNWQEAPFTYDGVEAVYRAIIKHIHDIDRCLLHYEARPDWYKAKLQALMNENFFVVACKRTVHKVLRRLLGEKRYQRDNDKTCDHAECSCIYG